MKIAVITLHRFDNVGSCLQAYALCEYIEYKGYDVQLIDYTPRYKEYFTLRKVLAMLLNRKNINTRMSKIGQCLAENTKLTKRYRSLKVLFREPPQADIYVSGGDQIWNPQYPNYYDDAFYLKFASLAPKMSYGSSVSKNDLSNEQIQYLKERLKDYYSINVREKRTAEVFVEKGINKNTNYVMDPVLLVKEEQYAKLATIPAVMSNIGNYIFVYHVDKNELLDKSIKKLSELTGYKVVSLSGFRNRWESDIYIKDVGPYEFLGLIQDASLVLTGSFHALVFSLIFKKEFAVLIPKLSPNRITNILQEVGLTQRIIRCENDIEPILNSTIDKQCYENLNCLVANSRELLDNALKTGQEIVERKRKA